MASQFSEQALIASASNGDLEAFNQLVLNYQHLAYRYGSALLNNPDSTEDITQESFIKAFLNIRSFRGGSFRAWLLKIVANTSHDRSRWLGKHPAFPLLPENEDGEEIESPSWIADPAGSVETVVQQREESHKLYGLLDELPGAYRSVITLIDLYELDYVEAAKVLNVPLGTIKSRLARARLQMKDKIRCALHSSISPAGQHSDDKPDSIRESNLQPMPF